MLAEANWTQLSVTLLATPALLKSLFYASQAAYASEDALITDSSCGRSCDLAPWAPGDAQLVRFPAGLRGLVRLPSGRGRRPTSSSGQRGHLPRLLPRNKRYARQVD
jgi:hypothetical protein